MTDLLIVLGIFYGIGLFVTFSVSLASLVEEMSRPYPDPDDVRKFRSALILSPIWPVAAFFALRDLLRRANDIIKEDRND